MNRIICLIIFTLFFGHFAKCQTTASAKAAPDIFQVITIHSVDQGNVTIQQDEKVKKLVNKYVEFRRKDNKIPGYRIRIFSNSGQTARTKAYSEKSKFTELYPDIVTYVDYEEPNFKVYVGDFRSKSDAFRAHKQISKEFRNAFVVPTKINLPKL